MGCGCAKRRKALEAKRAKKLAQGKTAQAAVIGMALTASEAVGNAIGLNGEDEHGERTDQGAEQHR